MQYLANYYSDLITVDSILQSSNKTDGSLRLPIIPVCAAEFCRRQTMRPRHVPSPPFPTPFPNTYGRADGKAKSSPKPQPAQKNAIAGSFRSGWHCSQEIMDYFLKKSAFF
jgi:hypothetical protein